MKIELQRTEYLKMPLKEVTSKTKKERVAINYDHSLFFIRLLSYCLIKSYSSSSLGDKTISIRLFRLRPSGFAFVPNG